MSFQQAGITSATPAKTLMDTLKAMIDAHAAWEHVATITSGSNTAEVFRCLGTHNLHGSDFYMAMRRTSDATTSVFVGISEGWNGTEMTKIAPYVTSSTTLAIEADGSYATARNPATHLAGTNGFIAPTTIGTLNTTGFTYWASVTNNYFAAGLIAGANTGVYAGAYEKYASDVTAHPIINIELAALLGSVRTGARTRDMWLAGKSVNYAFQVRGMEAIPGQIGEKDGILGKYRASRLQPVCYSRNASDGAQTPYLPLGVLSEEIAVVATEFAEAHGDLISVDGVQHVCVATSGPIWISKAA